MNGQLLAGRYRLGEAIGRGGMGRVWRATDELLGRPVAVKELTGDGGERMRQEARAAARISHPNVVTVHDVVVADDRPWIVMQLVEGQSLADAVERDGPLDPRRAAEVGVAVLAALRAAHAAGVLHRDVKPANVLLDRGGPAQAGGAGGGRVLLTDFGIAVIEGDTGLTRTGEIVGSVDYLAPERARGARPGPASDLWSLGATLFTAVEGYSAFRRATAINSLQAVVLEEAPPTRRAGALAPVIEALLAKDPDARPTAEHAAGLLAAVAAGRDAPPPAGYVPTARAPLSPLPTPTPTPPAPTPAPHATPLPARPPQPGPSRPLPVAASALAPAGVPALPTAARPVPYAGPPAYAAPTGPVRERGRGSRRRGLLVGVVVGGLVAAGGGFVAARQLTGGGGGHPSPTASDSAHALSADGVPKGYVTVHDPAGFSVAVPRGWKRQLDGDQIDYTADDDAHLLRVGIERSPTSPNPYVHLLSLEKSVSAFPHYRRERLHENTYRGGDGALWEFTWTSTEDHPGPRHAEEQGYRAQNGAEYEIYESAPAKDWTVAQERFQVALRTWKLTG